jgi:Abnormal spindle-like microcephaly-assoc'd, ASPM-SPD-2-Hydin
MGIQTGERAIGSSSGFPLLTFLRRSACVFASLFFFAGLFASQGHAAVQVSPTTINFGEVYVGSSITRDLTIQNTGSTGVTLSEAYIQGDAFVRSKLSLPLTISAGKSLTIEITYAPASAGSAASKFGVLTSASRSTISIPITGTGVKQTLSLLPASMNFHSVVVGSSGTQSATVTNTGDTSVTISGDSISGKGFTLTGITVPLVLASGKSTSFSVHFAPTSAGTGSGTVSLSTSAAAGWLRASLTAVGVAATRVLTATPSSLSFGSLADDSSATAIVSIVNTGNSAVSVSNVTATGAGFKVTGLHSGEVLTSGEVALLDVIFAPETTGSASGTVSIASSASNSPMAIVLSGTGAAAGPPYVALSWNASTSSVIGYNVYRGTTSGGPYSSKLTSSPVAELTFTDTTVQAGQTYYYVVTAVNASGVESADSNSASATVP